MSNELAQDLARHLPFLRRYARALSRDQQFGDHLVRACLEHLLQSGRLLERDRLKLELYRSLTRIWSEVANGQPSSDAGTTIENARIVAERIAHLAGPRRQILLLATLEGLSPFQVATVMDLPEETVRSELAAAKQELRSQPPTRILIIEDEPVIALDIARTVEDTGHTVTGIATTHREAVELARADHPGLVLADIQLSDDSSGIEAVKEILSHYQVPVIFITAFPDRLLTGERPEPTFLITKPFDPEILNVAISQALATADDA
ncbi:response regulator [Benzoatithermus flavus]|uniref:Response regulator n=1 Tax=Benzoatithermus flavus TaxID=3108223 RepID=A0ABU8XVA5_9PROT